MTMKQPPTESELRHVCGACGYIDYYNPKLVRLVGDVSCDVSPRTMHGHCSRFYRALVLPGHHCSLRAAANALAVL